MHPFLLYNTLIFTLFISDLFLGEAKVVFLAYNNLEELLGTQGAYKLKEKSSNEIDSGHLIVNSRIMSASINDPLISGELVKPVVLIFQHKQVWWISALPFK